MLKQELIGEPEPLAKVQRRANRKSIREIRGIAKAYSKAPRFVLRLESNHLVRVYVTADGLLGTRDNAKRFAMGFDDEETKRKYWAGRLGVKLVIEHV
jgi:hypothetical protein